ncbi:MAG: outer membrane beta-barrel protein [Dysgonamonadaceae bacterium]|jgi:hypothetical protein|nr:outer membrane beta-barrel protein [Dysgonamonadaceae bacterium]
MIRLSPEKINFFCLLIIVIGNIPLLHAQKIRGRVVTEQRLPVEYATLSLLSPIDSSLVDGAISSETGEFQMEKAMNKKMILKINHLGYKTQWMDIEINPDTTDLNDIVLQEDASLLNEIVVTPISSLFSRGTNNSLMVHVSSTILSSMGMAKDIIEQIPGISVNNDEITVFRKGAPVVYIDHRKLYDLRELSHIQSSDIATMELITQPDAKYDAEGRSVLIIKMKKNESSGWAIKASGQLKQGKYLGNSENIGITCVTDNLFLFTSYNRDADKTSFRPKVSYTTCNDTLWQQLIDLPQMHRYSSNQLTAGIDWSITEKQAIGGQYQVSFDNEKINSEGTEEVWMNNVFFDKIATKFEAKGKPSQQLINVFYQGNYNESFRLQLDVDYMNTRNDIRQQIEESSLVEKRNVNMESQSKYNLYAGKMTLGYHLNEHSVLELGGEYNRIKGSGFLNNPEQYVENSIYTNEEEKTAGFVSYNNVFDKLNFHLGFRYEQVHSKSTGDSTGQTKTDRKYRRFYPFLSLSQLIGKTQMSLELARKTQRPSFYLLGSNNYYVNRFLFEKGNPYIQNEDIYQVDYHVDYRIFDFSMGYVYKKNPIAFYLENVENSSSQSFMTYINYPFYQELNAQFTANFEYKMWRPRITVGMTQPFFSAIYLGKKVKRNQTGILFQFFNDVIFPKEYIFSAHFEFVGKNNEYIIENAGYGSLHLGLRKSFFNKNLLFNIQASDVFQWIAEKRVIEINNISYIKESRRETRFVTLTISYNFNNYTKKYRGKNVAEEDLKRF